MPRKREPALRNCLKELRSVETDLTQQALADEVGVTRQTIVAMEGDAYTPSLALALRISQVFNKQVEEIFWLEE